MPFTRSNCLRSLVQRGAGKLITHRLFRCPQKLHFIKEGIKPTRNNLALQICSIPNGEVPTHSGATSPTAGFINGNRHWDPNLPRKANGAPGSDQGALLSRTVLFLDQPCRCSQSPPGAQVFSMVARFQNCPFLHVPTHRKDTFWLIFFVIRPSIYFQLHFLQSLRKNEKRRRAQMRLKLKEMDELASPLSKHSIHQ